MDFHLRVKSPKFHTIKEMKYFNNRSLALAILETKEGYSPSELKTAYLKKAKVFHPDTGGTHEEFLKLQQAYEYLSKQPIPETPVKENLNNTSGDFKQNSDFRYVKTDVPTILKNLGFHAIELFVINFSNSTYLLKASAAQFILFGFWFSNLFNLIPISITLSWLLQLSLLSTYLLLVSILLIFLVAIFHRKIWYVSSKLEKLSPKKLNKIRNISLLLFTITTLPGYLIYLFISLSLKIIKLLLNMIK